MEKTVGRIIIIRAICDAKDTLFGPFDSERTLQLKMKVWTEILEKAKSLGLIAACKDYRYMRDIYWQNIKRHSLSKRANAGAKRRFKKTPIDEMVYEIVDNTSTLHTPNNLQHQKKYVVDSTKPALQQSVELKNDDMNFEILNDEDVTIEEFDHLKEEPPFIEDSMDEQNETQDEEAQEEKEPASNELLDNQAVEEPSSDDRPNDEDFADKMKIKKEEGSMKKRKMQLEIDFLELQNYKTQLEVLDLETKLGIEPSKFTKEIAKRRKRNYIVYENEEDEHSNM